MTNLALAIHRHALERPEHPALVQGGDVLSYAALDALMDRVASTLQAHGVTPGRAVAFMGSSTPLQAAVMLGALRAGAVVAPIATSVTPLQAESMLHDARACWLFVDRSATDVVPASLVDRCVALETGVAGAPFEAWLLASPGRPAPVALAPEAPFNIIYSSGTTGTPKGIVQSHGMRGMHVERGAAYGFTPQSCVLLATPLYSNTTLVIFAPALAHGSTVVLMARFDARTYLQVAQHHRATHTMLVPVQYQRLMALPDFDRFDLRSFEVKFCTSAPFAATLKADVLKRWPGQLIEFYGMTEGGGTCILEAHLHPDKLHTVGRPADGHDIRLIDDEGRPSAPGASGEVVGHSPAMMSGYHGQPDKTREAEWYDDDGRRFIRTGDIGRFDGDGFLSLLDRKKDMIISGGFNIYPSDLETELRRHPAVADVAVVGMPSERWGETPVAFVVPAVLAGAAASMPPVDGQALLQWLNARVGKVQRVSAVVLLAELPRSAIGKVLKRELRQRHEAHEGPGRDAP